MAESQNSKQNVQAPQAGQTVIVNAIPGQDIVLEAAFDQAEVKMDGGNVVFEFANGGQVVLDFTDLGDAQAPNVVMPDGTVLDMQEFLASLGEKDVEPAAGPDGGATGSGGVGEYQDDAGDVIGGTDKLGVLGPRDFSTVVVEGLEASNSIPILLGPDGVLVEDEAIFPEGNNEDEGGVGVISGTIVDNVDWGADGFGGVNGFTVGGASFSAGSTVFWGQDGTFLGTSGVGGAASLLVNADGTYDFGLIDNMLLGQGVQGEQIDVLSTVQIIGADSSGDTVTVPLTLSVQDDVPVLLGGNSRPDEPADNDVPDYDGDEPVAFAARAAQPAPGENGNTLVNGLGGDRGFGENFFAANDDGSVEVDVSSVFPDGMNFFGAVYNQIYINNNGNITFAAPQGTFTPFAITGSTANPMIAPFFADVDTTGATGNVSPGGTSTGSNLVWYDLDSANGVLTVTWDDVGYFNSSSDKVNAFQLRIFDQGGGNFSFEFRYENVDWTTGDASGGSGGLGGTVARAGWTAGNGKDFFELSPSGNQAGMLDLEATSNPSTASDGNWVFNVVGGVVSTGEGADIATVEDESIPDSIDGITNELDDNGVGSFAQNIRDNVSWGADGFGKVVEFYVQSEPESGPFAAGEKVYWAQDGSFMGAATEAPEGAAAYLLVKVDGDYEFTLIDNMLMGNDPQRPGEQTDFLDAVEIVGADADGDTVTVKVTLNVQDDVPVVMEASETATVEDESIPDSIGGITNETDNGVGSFVQNIRDNVSWGADGFGEVVEFHVQSETFAAGEKVYWAQDGSFLGAATEAPEGAAAYLLVKVDGDYEFTLIDNMLMGNDPQRPGEQTDFLDTVEIVGADADGDTVTVNVTLNVQDDVPILTVGVNGPLAGRIAASLDETVGEADRYNDNDNDNDVSDDGNTDDALPTLAQVTTEITGGLAALFTVGGDYGADGPGQTVGTLSFDGFPENPVVGLETTLSATDGGKVWLFLEDGAIVGRDSDIDSETGKGDMVLAIRIVNTGTEADPVYQMETTQYEALEHFNTSKLDESISLHLAENGSIGLKYTVTRSDADGDVLTESAVLPLVSHSEDDTQDGATDFSYLSFDDDGPLVDVTSTVTFTLTVQNLDKLSSAGFNNSFGYYVKDDNGDPESGKILWANVKNSDESSEVIQGYTPDQIGFFIIPDGFDKNSSLPLSDGLEVYFKKDGAGNWQAKTLDGDNPLTGEHANVLFDVADLNQDDIPHATDNGLPGNLNWEDILKGAPGFDNDHNDVNIAFKWSSDILKLTTQDADTIGIDNPETTTIIEGQDSASASFAGLFEFTGDAGSDGEASSEITYALSVTADDSGLSIGGESIVLAANPEGTEIIGSAGGEPVFSITLGEGGAITLTQFKQVDHFVEDADGDATNNSANLVSILDGRIALTASYTIVDGDGDIVTDSKAIDISGAFNFVDDAPEANGAQNVVIANVPTPDATTNLILTLDLSGSMAGDKLAASIAAMKSVIQQYEDAGKVNVQITTFGTNAGPSTAWLGAVDAIAALEGFSAYHGDGGWTNYEAAIHHTIRGDGPDAGTATDVRPGADQTVAYFVTDGEPNREYLNLANTVDPQTNPFVGEVGDVLDGNYVSAWQNFVGDSVNHLFVVAVEASANDPYLQKLVGGVSPLAGGTVKIVEVTDTDNMVQILDGTVVTEDPTPVSATASLGIDIGTDGWGGAQISDVATMADGNDAVRYVTGVAANGDAIIATSGGVKLVYEDDGNGGLVAVTDDAARKVVFEVSLDQQSDGTPNGTYTVTMIGTVDPYVVAGESKTSSTSEPLVTETPGLPVSLTKTDSLTFVGADSAGGGKAQTLDISKLDTNTGITFSIRATGDDHRTGTNAQADYVNWSGSGIGVGNNSIDNPDNHRGVPSETLKLVISATNLPSGVTGIKIDSIDLVFDKLDNDETAKWNVSPGSVNDGSTKGFGNGSSEANDIPVNIVLGSGSTGVIEFSAKDGDSYRIDPGAGIKVNYSYIVDEQTTVVETKTVTTETTTVENTAYDITFVYKVDVTDGDNDHVASDFHVTIDANNDGIMHSVDSDAIVGNADVQSSSTITTVVNTHVYYNDGGTIVDVSNDTVTSVTNASSSSNVSVVASGDNANLMETVGSLIDPTDDDVMVAGDDQDYAMFGGGGDDILLGGDGDDFLVGNAGADIMTGGAGSDSFEPANGADTITDFNDGIDTMLTTINPELP